MRCGSHWVVHEGRLDERDGWWSHVLQPCPRSSVCLLPFTNLMELTSATENACSERTSDKMAAAGLAPPSLCTVVSKWAINSTKRVDLYTECRPEFNRARIVGCTRGRVAMSLRSRPKSYRMVCLRRRPLIQTVYMYFVWALLSELMSPTPTVPGTPSLTSLSVKQ